MKELTFENWVETYKPLRNANGDILKYDTYGEDMDFIKTQNPLTVWTEKNTDGSNWIASNMGRVNRQLFYVCEIPFDEGFDAIVPLEPDPEVNWDEDGNQIA